MQINFSPLKLKIMLLQLIWFLSQELKQTGVIAASAGNHALAVAYHGKDLNIPVTVVMPTVAPLVKVQRCRDYGANVIIHGRDINEVRYQFKVQVLYQMIRDCKC